MVSVAIDQSTQQSSGTQQQSQGSSGPRHFGPVTNVGDAERVVSVLAGSLLVSSGIRRFNLKGAALAFIGYRMIKRGATGQCSVYKALNIAPASAEHSLHSPSLLTNPFYQHVRVQKSVTINRSAEDIYKYWRDFTNFPGFMENIQSVEAMDNVRSHWVAKGIGGKTVDWTASIVEDIPNQKIAWKSDPGAQIPNEGNITIRTLSNDRGTELTVTLTYDPPAGIFGELLAFITGRNPAAQVEKDLKRFKQLLETGEIPTIDGQPHGNCTGCS